MKPVRRVIVGQNKEDQSFIIKDGPAQDIDSYLVGVDSAVSINLWSTLPSPTLSNFQDPAELGLPFLPPLNGTAFRICDIPPDSVFIDQLDDLPLNEEKMGEGQNRLKYPLMQKMDAISYGIVLSGEVTLILDNESTLLKTGDIIIDCGSHHAWSNQTNEICRMAFILIDARR